MLRNSRSDVMGKLFNSEHLVLQGPQGSRVQVNGNIHITFSSNDYLGLANHQEVKKSAIEAIHRFGAGIGASRTLSGSTLLHEKLEKDIAGFKRNEAALLFNSGFNANAGLMPGLVGPDDTVISDQFNHGSIVIGCRLSGAKKLVYRHNDMCHLESLLKSCSPKGKRLIAADTVFSMSGVVAPLEDMQRLAVRWGAELMLDEAHATGVIGEHGVGALSASQCDGAIVHVVGTLGKAIGSIGGYVVGSDSLIRKLVGECKPYLLTTALPPSSVAAAIAGLRILQREPCRRRQLWENTKKFRKPLIEAGLNLGNSTTPITPIYIGSSDLAKELYKKILLRRVVVSCICPPLVPENTARLRAIVTAIHSEEDLNHAARVIIESARELNVI